MKQGEPTYLCSTCKKRGYTAKWMKHHRCPATTEQRQRDTQRSK